WTHQTTRKVTLDIQSLRFNTAISQLMILANRLKEREELPKEVVETFVLLLSPFTPHICEELWEMMRHDESLAFRDWPEYDEELAREELVTIAVQVNGKLRAEFEIGRDSEDKKLIEAALELSRIRAYTDGKDVKRTIVVKNRLVNVVVEVEGKRK
ncbi:MAG: class I tRNA ligase family protein, partial [Candidatus Neomarinimicrobiota bacterium]